MAHNKKLVISDDVATLTLFINTHNLIAITIEDNDPYLENNFEIIQLDKDDCIALIDELTSLIKEI